MKTDIFETGKFFVGCNYWASHAGTFMWRNWDAEQVDRDLAKLEEGGLTVLRVFPLWPDFQPLKRMYGVCGKIKEMRLGEEAMPFTEEGKCGIDPVMADRFAEFCDIAEKHHMKLIVGLITGWMSGRLHMPDGLGGLDPLTNPTAVKWEIKFVRYMVRRFKDHPAIGAWDLGNECNCMGDVREDSAFVWASIITNTVRSEDRDHVVVSGMHGLKPEGHAWTPADQGEILDILCTHPYPQFTAYCNIDPFGSMRSVLHATAESVYFGTMGGKPCFVEEAGNLGPMIASDEKSGDYMRASVFSAWAHDLRGYTWWCAHDQTELPQAPYDWHPMERELGLIRNDGTKKPDLIEMKKFADFVNNDFPYEKLPSRIVDAVCVITKAQDHWGVAFGTFMLAKQAGLDVEFAWCEDKIPESRVYMLPSVCGGASLPKRLTDELMRRVERGATLYVSINDALIAEFDKLTGLKVVTRSRACGDTQFTIDGETMRILKPFTTIYENAGAEVLLADDGGTPLVTEKRHGAGRVVFVSAPIELNAATHTGVVRDGREVPYIEAFDFWKIYELASLRDPAKVASCAIPTIGLTEHIVSEKERIVTVLNHTPDAKSAASVTLSGGWHADAIYSVSQASAMTKTADGFVIDIPGNTGAVVVLKK